MSTFEEVLKQKAEEAKKITGLIPLDQIPSEIKLKWISEEYKKDAKERECLFVLFEAEDTKRLQQKYTMSMFEELSSAIEACGGKEKLTSNFFFYKKKEVGKKGSFQRLYPVAEASRRKK